MKRVLLGALVVSGMALVSCKKDYVCDCHYDIEVDGTEEHVDEKFEYSGVRKKDAEDMCDTQEELFLSQNLEHVHCQLK